MTTGERLVSISTLSTGTALEHFLNIETGTGDGGEVRVYGNYNVTYEGTVSTIIRYISTSKILVSYKKQATIGVEYSKKSPITIKYDKSKVINIKFQCKQ